MSELTPLWECERCHKLVPYMCHFCVDCTYDLVGEPPKPYTPRNVALTCYYDMHYRPQHSEGNANE